MARHAERASVVIEWWWHFERAGISRRMKRSASVKLLGRGSAVTSSCLAFELRGLMQVLDSR